MNVQHLKYIIEVQRTGSISQAAENLYMSQPNLSKAIRELEAQMGLTIFRRTSKGIEVTAKGQVFLEHARQITAQIAALESLYKSGDSGKQFFSISVPRSSYVAKAFSRFSASLNESQPIELDYMETNTMGTINNVINGRSNIGIIRFNKKYEDSFAKYLKEKRLIFSHLLEFTYLALMHREHPLAGQPDLGPDQLKDYLELIYGDCALPFAAEEREAYGNQPLGAKYIYLYERGSLFDLLSQNHRTYIWSPPLPAETLQRFDLVQRKCEAADHIYCDMLIKEKHNNITALEQRFLDELAATRQELSTL
ncbi:MAG: LysR family transcriptional regulator [Clostridia bacterium]|nr:LysR family transcriptional regulator [Clostridia bacterium]